MDSPTDTLRHEHRVILLALDTLASAADRMAAGERAPSPSWTALLAWLSAFADRNHHAKEERALFPALVQAGIPADGGPVGTMLEEHAEGRALIQAMGTGDATSRRQAALRYVQLLRDHIDKENGVLFPLADAVLDHAAQAALGRAFDAIEAEQGASGSIHHAEAQIAELRAAEG